MQEILLFVNDIEKYVNIYMKGILWPKIPKALQLWPKDFAFFCEVS